MIEAALKEASKSIPIYWPLPCFIAINPLWGLHEQSFQEALMSLKDVANVEGVMPLSFYQEKFSRNEISIEDLENAIQEYVKRKDSDLSIENLINILSKTNAVIFSSKQPATVNVRNNDLHDKIQREVIQILMNYFCARSKINSCKEYEGLFNSWRYQVARFNKKLNDIVNPLAKDKLVAITQLLKEYELTFDDQVRCFKKIFYSVMGWASLIKWLEQRPDNPYLKRSAQLIDFLLIWLCYEKYYRKQRSPSLISAIKINDQSVNGVNSDTDYVYRFIVQRALEIAYQRKLFNKLMVKQLERPKLSQKTPMVQAIFCIDTRSEGLRRHFEKRDSHETFGFAGFFGYAFQYNKYNDWPTLQCPALFSPEVHLNSQHDQSDFEKLNRCFTLSCQKAKKSLFAPMAFVEMTGIWFAILMFIKSCSGKIYKKCMTLLGYDSEQNILQDKISSAQINAAFSLEIKIRNAKQFLRTIGLTKAFAPVILICGHGAQTDNNPYQASFDCGACGGNAGFANAIVAMQVLNDTEVRHQLKACNIDIPKDTFFIAGFHNTTRDQVTLYEEQIPLSLKPKINQLKQDLAFACSNLRAERSQGLPGFTSVLDRASNWSELIPEMALINNAALIVGPRYLTKHISLERRVFLQSYDPAQDPDGQLLTGILLGPLIVAHWINAQYYFSTTDPNVYGSGNKIIHNVLPNIGVIEGNFSDLKIGLPWQSIGFQNKVLHQPLRLLVIIYARKKIVDALLNQNPSIKALFTQQWAHLKVLEPGD